MKSKKNRIYLSKKEIILLVLWNYFRINVLYETFKLKSSMYVFARLKVHALVWRILEKKIIFLRSFQGCQSRRRYYLIWIVYTHEIHVDHHHCHSQTLLTSALVYWNRSLIYVNMISKIDVLYRSLSNKKVFRNNIYQFLLFDKAGNTIFFFKSIIAIWFE